MIHYFTFGGIDSRSLGIYLTAAPSLSGAVPRLERTPVPGRNGDLTTWDGSFENRTLKLQCAVIAASEAQSMVAVNRMCFSLMGYQRLTLSTDPDHYLMAQVITGGEQTPIDMKAGRFTLTMDCQPERWLLSGDQEIQVEGENLIYPGSTLYPGAIYPYAYSAKIINPAFAANPIFVVYGNGTDGTFTVNSNVITIEDAPEDGVVIDSVIMDSYSPDGLINLNGIVSFSTGAFPRFNSGENVVSWDGSALQRIIMYPRWWDL